MSELSKYTPHDIDTLVHQGVENEDIGFIITDGDTRVRVWNKWIEQASGKLERDVIGLPIADVFPEIRESRLEDALFNALEKGMAGLLSAKLHRDPPLRLKRLDADGSPLTNPVIILRPLDGTGEARKGCLIQIIDETASATRERTLKSQAINLRAHEEQLRTLFEAINDSVILLDRSGSIIAANDTACLRLRGTKSTMIGSHINKYLSEQSVDVYNEHIMELFLSNSPQRFEDSVGDEIYSVSMFPVPDSDGEIKKIAVLASDITDRKAFEQRIYHLAHHDALTGLPNRVYLMDRIEHAVKASRRFKRKLALMFLDLDHFKSVNDTMGHDSGDALLKFVAARLSELVRNTDTVARMGGDEFVILLESAGQEADLARLAEKIIDALDQQWASNGEVIHVTTSIGISNFPENGGDARLLMKAADTAMYAAKADGRNTFRFFSEDMTERTLERLHLERDIRDAIVRRQFEVHYQPKVCFESKTTSGVEALIRWRHPERGMISPTDFIPLAEETGIIIGIGDWVLEEVCKQIATWVAAGREPVPIAVNVSPKQLSSPNFVRKVTACIARHNIPSSMLHIEITEGAVMADPDKASAILSQLRDHGISIAIDDFGTGYSSLAYLSRLPIDMIKIDRSFVAGLADSNENHEIINAIVSLGRSLKMIVIAEGIETTNDVSVLTEASCDHGQGYLFAKPMAVKALEAWLDEQSNGSGHISNNYNQHLIKHILSPDPPVMGGDALKLRNTRALPKGKKYTYGGRKVFINRGAGMSP